MNKAIFIDRDGVINKMVDRGENCVVSGKKVRHTAPWAFEEFELLPSIKEALIKIGEKGYLRILTTNQPDIAYKLLPPLEHEKIMNVISALPLDDIYVCPHGRDEGCACKKPKPGMLLEASEKWDIDLSSSYMIGDSLVDIGAGKAAGCKTIFISPAGETQGADNTATNLFEAVNLI